MLRIRIAPMALFLAMFLVLIPYVHAADVSATPPTAGIPTGMIKFGSSSTAGVPKNPRLDWGDGLTSTALMDCRQNGLKVDCDYWGHQHVYANPGRPVTLTATYTDPVTFKTNSAQGGPSFTVAPIGDFVIVSVGDSVASGEGNPVVAKASASLTNPYAHAAYWDYGDTLDYAGVDGSANGCHGSSTSGPAIAARQIKHDNPSAHITFIHMACSGARIGESGSALTPDHTTGQIDALKKILPAGTKIDALLISTGANSVDNGFQTIIKTCVSYACDDTSSPYAKVQDFQTHLYDIKYLDYGALDTSITDGTLNVSDDNVYITEYFDPTHDSTGTHYPSNAVSQICEKTASPPPPITHSEWEYLHDNLLKPLNDRINTVAGQYGWHYVGGIAADYATHGYCVDFIGVPGTTWVVHAGDSVTNQGDTSGTSHPNLAGHKDYSTHIVDSVYQWTLPVTTATASTSGGNYQFGAWAHGDVAVTLAATNKLQQSGTGSTYYSVDNPDCSDTDKTSCTVYSSPFSITTPGTHTVYFFSANAPKDSNDKALPVEFEKVTSEMVQIDAPSASDDTVTTQQDNPISGQLTASNPNGDDTLAFSIIDQPKHGTISLDDANKGTFTYTPANGYVGKDSFTFKVNNGYLDSNTATESITVADDPPVATNNTAGTTTDQAVSGQLKASDPDSADTLTFSIVAQPSHGTVTLDDTQKGTFTYTPDAGYAGDDTFTFNANDGHVDSNTATENVTIAASAASKPSGGGSSGGGGGGGTGPILLLVLLTLTGLRGRKSGRHG